MENEKKRDKFKGIYVDSAEVIGVVDTSKDIEGVKWSIYDYSYFKKLMKVFEVLHLEDCIEEDRIEIGLEKHDDPEVDAKAFYIRVRGAKKALALAGMDRNAV